MTTFVVVLIVVSVWPTVSVVVALVVGGGIRLRDIPRAHRDQAKCRTSPEEQPADNPPTAHGAAHGRCS